MAYAFQDCELDEERFELRRGGAPVELQPKVLELLLYLARQGDRLVPKRELLEAIWPDAVVGESSLTRLVSLARRAIGDQPGDGAIIATVSGRGYRWLGGAAQGAAATAGRAALAVLPFADLSAEGDQEYLADGLAEDLMMRLARFRWFPVVARQSAFAGKGRGLDVREAGRTLGARYLVEGSVQRAGARIRVTARLADTASGHQMWADRIERPLRDVFALQDEISEAIVAAIEPELWERESERAARAPAQNLDVWQAVQRGWWHLGRSTAEDDALARALCARAVELEPPIARSFYALEGSRGTEDGGELLAAAGASPALAALGRAALHARARRRDRLRAAIEDAVQADPASAHAHRWLGLLLATAPAPRGPARRARAVARTSGNARAVARTSGNARAVARARDPLDRIRSLGVALFEFGAGHHEAAMLAPLEESTPEWILGFALRVASLAHAGRVAESRSLLAGALERKHELSFDGLRALLALADPALPERIDAGLRLAGWGE